MLTVDYARLGVRPGERLLDLGCGFGRHAYQAARLGAEVVALDAGADEVRSVRDTLGAMADAGELDGEQARVGAVQGDALSLPFATASFDRVIASEILEHIPDDCAAMAELARVLRPGGTMAVTVPRCGPEFVNWALSDAYHDVPGGHVRIYRHGELVARLRAAGLEPTGSHHAHGLHAPYWWLRCLVGPTNDTHPAVAAYHRLLVVGHREGAEGHPVRRAGPQPAGRQEPGRLPGEAGARPVRTTAVAVLGVGRGDDGSELMRSIPEVPGVMSAAEVLADRGVDRVTAASRRDDPLVPGRPLRPVEPRRVGDGPHRGWPRRPRRPRLPSGSSTRSSPTAAGSTTT